MDEHRSLQSRAYPARCYSRQNGLQKESRKADEVVAQGRAGTAAQLPKGRVGYILILEYI